MTRILPAAYPPQSSVLSYMKWRYTHMRLAFRIIGSKVLSLKGVPAAQLESETREPLFPQLWETISALTSDYKPGY